MHARTPISRLVAALIVAAAPLAATSLANAQVLTERNVSLELANRIAAASVAACKEKGYSVAATVVDRAGIVRAVQRADNAGPHTIGASLQKAYTSASARTSTLVMMENAQKNPGLANLTDIPGFLLLGGGVPIKAGDVVIGAVGIGGAPAGSLDDECAIAALDSVKDLLK